MRAGAKARTKRCPYGATTTGHGASASSPATPGSPASRFWPTTIASGRSRRASASTASAKGMPESGR